MRLGKCLIYALTISVFLYILTGLAFAKQMPIGAKEIDIGGFLKLDKHFSLDEGKLHRGNTFVKSRLELKSDISDNTFAFSSLDLRFYHFPKAAGRLVKDLEAGYPIDISLWEAYVELYGVLSENIDLKFGKQRINWGRADKIQPTDNLNPDDFTNFFGFEEKLPNWAAKATYYFGDFNLSGVWVPFMEPVLFPRGGVKTFFAEDAYSLKTPGRQIENGMFALKLSGSAFNGDFSLSYFRGWDDLPVEIGRSADDNLIAGFSKLQVIGMDFATEYRSVGYWAEGAINFAEEVKSEGNTMLSNDPYFAYVLGMDYTFKNGIYLNAQYVHGFPTQRGRGYLSDYLVVRLEKKFLNDELNISISGAVESPDLDEANEKIGVGFFPEVEYSPVDNLTFTLGAYILDGKSSTLLGSYKDSDEVYFKIRIDF